MKKKKKTKKKKKKEKRKKEKKKALPGSKIYSKHVSVTFAAVTSLIVWNNSN